MNEGRLAQLRTTRLSKKNFPFYNNRKLATIIDVPDSVGTKKKIFLYEFIKLNVLQLLVCLHLVSDG